MLIMTSVYIIMFTKQIPNQLNHQPLPQSKPKIETKPEKESIPKSDKKQEKENVAPSSPPATPAKPAPPPERRPAEKKDKLVLTLVGLARDCTCYTIRPLI